LPNDAARSLSLAMWQSSRESKAWLDMLSIVLNGSASMFDVTPY
jgi:hypothetical protein